MTPMQCAALMMRNHADPGLIVAYLRLELERDPRIAMTTWQRLVYDVIAAFAGIRSAASTVADALQALPLGNGGDYALAQPEDTS